MWFFSEVPQHELCVFPTNENNCNHMQAKWYSLRNACMKDTQNWLVDFQPNVYINSDSETNIKKTKKRQKKPVMNAWNLFLEYLCTHEWHTCAHFTLQLVYSTTSTGEVLGHTLQSYHSRSTAIKKTQIKQKPNKEQTSHWKTLLSLWGVFYYIFKYIHILYYFWTPLLLILHIQIRNE